MAATATMTYRVTLPKKASVFLSRKAKKENTTIPREISRIVEDMIEYAEEGHIWEEALRNAKTCTGDFVSHEDAWK